MLHYSVCLGSLNVLRILIIKIMSFSRPSFSCFPVILFNPHLRMPYCTYSLLCSTPVSCISTSLTFSTSFILSLYHFLQLYFCIISIYLHFSRCTFFEMFFDLPFFHPLLYLCISKQKHKGMTMHFNSSEGYILFLHSSPLGEGPTPYHKAIYSLFPLMMIMMI